jgi:hypothetical protein
MKIFISWSGLLSQKIGEAFKDWLPAVIQSVKPYFTPTDIEKGSRWNTEIAKELEASKFGIFIYTKENIDSQWMMFEAGAISKTLDSTKVCPILFGLDNSDFKGPLTQFQTSQFSKQDIRKLLRAINNNLSEQKLEDKVLEEVFEMWYPKLESKIKKIQDENNVVTTSIRNDREILEEVLALVRLTAKNTSTSRNLKGNRNYDSARLECLVNKFIGSTIMIFELDWEHTKNCLSTDNIEFFITDQSDFLRPGVVNEDNDWKTRGEFLHAFRELRFFMEENGIINLEKSVTDNIPF